VSVAGPLLFARYAYPPNALGYCGPADHDALLGYGTAGVVDTGLRDLAKGFEGAWPYLELIAAANHIDDPLDAHVVAAYWIGNAMLDQVPIALLGNSLNDRFRRIAGHHWNDIVESVCQGSVPHHNFHVFSIYPWVGMLRGGLVDQPLRVLDCCRVRWGQVISVQGGVAIVRASPLNWDGSRLSLGAPILQAAACPVIAPRPRDWVALHWDWVSAVLSTRQLHSLREYTARELAVANRARGPALARLSG
jgi:hypothetical protein